MIRSSTASGFEFAYETTRADDMRFIEVLASITDEGTNDLQRLAGVGRAAEFLLGKEQKNKLYEHIGKTNDGRVPPAELEKELVEIMNAAGKDAGKN